MMKKWIAIPALAVTILMGGVALTNAANEVTVTSENFMSDNHEQEIDAVDFGYDFIIDAISGNVN
jgi:hypothetical protein